MSDRYARRLTVTLGVLMFALVAVVTVNSRQWLGKPFPGFFVMANRVVASITLPGWLDGSASAVLQHQVLAVDGEPVVDPDAVYAAVQARPPGTPVRYTVRSPRGEVTTVSNRTRTFSPVDYALIMGAYLLNGLAFLGVGLIVFGLKPRHPASPALLIAGVTTAVWVITAVDLYGPYWFVRLHVIGESMFGAGLLHFALVFPVNRLEELRRRRRVLWAIYLAAAALAAYYEMVLHRPGAYTRVHLMATAMHAIGVAAVMMSFTGAYATTTAPLLRRRIAVVALGSIAGFVVPGMALWGAAMLGGAIPINASAFTAFLFPLSLGFAIIKRDVFEIDVLLRRTVVYLCVVGGLTIGYVLAMFGVNLVVPTEAVLAQSPFALALVHVGILLLLAPLRARVETAVDRMFFRLAYDPGVELAEFGRHVASARTLHTVTSLVRVALDRTVVPARSALYLAEPDGVFRWLGGREPSVVEFRLPPELAEPIGAGRVVARYEWDDRRPERRPALFDSLRADALLPVRSKDELVGLMVMGPKRDGRSYRSNDIGFLEMLTGQVTLAIKNAQAWEALQRQEMDARRLAEERGRLAELRTRFITNASHEFRTPLTSILAATDILTRYADRLTPEQRAERLERVRRAVGHMTELLEDVLTLGRAQTGRLRCERQIVDVGALCGEIVAAVRARASKAHRLEVGGDALACQANLDRKLLRHVLENLLGNAVKYSPDGGRVMLEAKRGDGTVVFRVVDEGIGIALDDRATLFEPFQRGSNVGTLEGSGLGLAITHEAVVAHGGEITCDSEIGVGSTFVVSVPATVTPRPPADGDVRIVIEDAAASPSPGTRRDSSSGG